MITIRKYRQGEESALWDIFFNTVRSVNIKDYSEAQVQAWAPEAFDPQLWQQRIAAINPFVAILNNKIVGYADIQADGYIDHFFCHSNYQGRGIGSTLMRHILVTAQTQQIAHCYSHVSITAKPFFEHFGFEVFNSQQVTIRGELLTNYIMEKQL
ncbi:GNAT family N-acetyltransferase [Endozoicomonadaceae bacterium StTr2]